MHCYWFPFENTQLSFRNVLKTNHSARCRIRCLQKCDGLSICANELPCPDISVAHYPLRSLCEMQAASTSAEWRIWCVCCGGGGPRGLAEHCPPSWFSVERVMLTVHSWQSVSSPPTTMRYPRCGEQGLRWLQLKPSSSRRTCRLWSFFFQRAQMLTLLYAWETLQPSLPRKKKFEKCRPLVTDTEQFKSKVKCLNQIKSQNIVDWCNESHLLSTLSRLSWCKLEY